MNVKSRTRLAAAAVLGGALVLAGMAAPAVAGHGDDFPVSTGIYRIPYAAGTTVDVWQDHHTHGGTTGNKDRTDLTAGKGSSIVAAAGGWIRFIRDHNGDTFGRGDGFAHDVDELGSGATVQNDALEHGCSNNNPDPMDPTDPPNPIFGTCAQYNNYVWIEHPNGEWTKYTHFGTGTVTIEAGRVLDEWVDAGDFLGFEDDIGAASGSPTADHLHFEVAAPNDPAASTLPLTSVKTGFISLSQAQNLVPQTCDGDGNVFFYDVANDGLTANPCDHDPPTADAGGPYVVDEGSSIQLDGTQSDDPDNNPLTYAWDPDDNLDDAALAEPTYTGLDDTVDELTLFVYDQIEQLRATATTTVTVNNVAPSVTAVGDTIDEGGTAVVSATFTDPGTLDTHTMQIDWGDGGPITLVPTEAQLANGLSHVYGDNGVYEVTVQVTDDDGGVGTETVDVVVGNLDPSITLGVSDTVSFPGGDYAVVGAGGELDGTADGSDPGSDDLTFSWSTGDATTYFNGAGPDPLPSPFGTFPFLATDSVDAGFDMVGVDVLSVTLTDDDGGSDETAANVIVTGTADSTFGQGWWNHQYSGQGEPHIDDDLAAGYLDIVNAVSSVYSEETTLGSAGDAHAVLSPPWDDHRARAETQLLLAWLHFASGAVSWDATVPLDDGDTVAFLDLMFTAEQTIVSDTSTGAELHSLELDLRKVRHAG